MKSGATVARHHHMRAGLLLALLLVPGSLAWAQAGATAPAAPTPPATDRLGRDTPRGTVLGFMSAARKGDDELSRMYLDTNLRGEAAVELAHQLFLVLDSRLPARLNALSDRPEGATTNPLKPDQNVVGTINTASGPLDIVVERITPKNSGPVWLFSRQTLSVIPDVYAEVDLVRVDPYLPDTLAKPRILGIRLFEWLVLFLVLPLCYRLLAITNWLVAPLLAFVRRRSGVPNGHDRRVPGLFRLVIMGIAIRWIVSSLELPFFERQFWWAVAGLMLIVALGWSLVLLNAVGERYFTRRLAGSGEVTLLLRLARRGADGLGIALCVFVVLRYFGFDPTAALAGLGIGGIAVALAAQKTLENVIAGLSLIFDKAVSVGDALRFNGTVGTVDHIGLRSTRIRTLDRTILSVPNGQIAAGGIETLSARDKFRFYHVVGLQYGTTVQQMRSVIEGVRTLLLAHPSVDADSVRVRFFRLGAFSLDIEVAVYIFAADWEPFLAIQQDLLLRIMDTIEGAGTAIAFPSQTVHIADGGAAGANAQVASSSPTPPNPPLKVAQSA